MFSVFRRLVAPLLVISEASTRSPKELEQLLQRLSHPRPVLRRQAIREMATRAAANRQEVLPALLQATDSSEWETRVTAIELIGAMGTEAAAASLHLIRLLQDSDPTIQTAAARALGQIGAEQHSMVPTLLLQMFRRGEVPPLPAVQTFGLLGSLAKEALPLILDALRQQDEDELRVAAALALGQLHEPGLLPFLYEQLALEWDDQVRAHLLAAIVTLEMPSGTLVPMLTEALEQEAMELQLVAIRGLGLLEERAEEAVPTLLSMFWEEGEWEMRTAIVHALARIQSADVAADLLESLEEEIDVDAGFAMDLVYALGRLGGQEADRALAYAFEAEEPALVARALLTLKTLDSISGIQRLRLLQAFKGQKDDTPLTQAQLAATSALAQHQQGAFTKPLWTAVVKSLGQWAERVFEASAEEIFHTYTFEDDVDFMPSLEARVMALHELADAAHWLKQALPTLLLQEHQAEQAGLQDELTWYSEALQKLQRARLETAALLQSMPLDSLSVLYLPLYRQVMGRLDGLDPVTQRALLLQQSTQMEDALFGDI